MDIVKCKSGSSVREREREREMSPFRKDGSGWAVYLDQSFVGDGAS